jgi:hypothetical protein
LVAGARRSGDLRLTTLLSQDPRDDSFRAMMRLHYQQSVEGDTYVGCAGRD